MGTAVVLLLSDDGQMMVGEVDEATIDTEGFVPVKTFEEGVSAAETLLLGEEPPESIQEDAFNTSVGTPEPDPLMEQ